MKYFLETVDAVEAGVGFNQFDSLHLAWLCLFAVITLASCLWYRKMRITGKNRWKKTIAALLIADELFKVVMLIAGNRYTAGYLPLHLCSINIFLITLHSFKPSKVLGGYLYTVGIPGAVAALLFPSWTTLPLMDFMHIHSFTVHILLALYPIVLAASGELSPRIKMVPKYLLLLLAMAIPIYGVNLLLNTNFMFLFFSCLIGRNH